MRYIWQHIQYIIENYKGITPLASFMKEYCRHHPKLGSRDRKLLGNMAYSWYRCEKVIHPYSTLSFEQKLKICLHLCGFEPYHIVFKDVEYAEYDCLSDNLLYPCPELSFGIEKETWLPSMLVQPSLFIRVRKDKKLIINLLQEKDIPFSFISPDCLSLPNGAKIDALLPTDSYVVQDASSQQTGNYFQPQKNERWYDCCAGAGGKSLLLKDLNPSVQLTVSDLRESILHNLHNRFRLYHHHQPVGRVTDASDKTQLARALGRQLFDNIICDAPCSGSGTWSRTPEQLYFFNPAALIQFAERQLNIAKNVAHYLKPGGRLIYITCSVFAEENEMVVEKVARQTGMQLLEARLINGIEIKADCMFIAVFQK